MKNDPITRLLSLVMLVGLLCFGAVNSAYATKPTEPTTTQDQVQGQLQGQLQGQTATSNQNQSTSSNANSVANGYGTANNDGVNISDDSNFFAFATQFPQAADCFGGAQAGAGGHEGGGIFGLHLLNNDCWAAKMASAQKDAEVKALLNCGGPQFRKSIAYNKPRRERQAYCVSYMTEKYRAEIRDVDHRLQEQLRRANSENERLRADKEFILSERQKDYEQCKSEKAAMDERCTK